jgi:DTW domain-containing protein YfiP
MFRNEHPLRPATLETLEHAQTPNRRRKTKAPCPGCFLHASLCMCAQMPRLDLKTRVVLIVHAKELKRTTNTGRLAHQCLSNSAMYIRGQGRAQLDLSALTSAGNYRSLVFFPSDDAVELTAEFVQQDPRPIQLIVPDGNWRQAAKVPNRHPELAGLPRVRITAANQAKHHLRAESTPYGMSTLEAVARALGVIESREIFEKLYSVYGEKLKRTLKARGIQENI